MRETREMENTETADRKAFRELRDQFSDFLEQRGLDRDRALLHDRLVTYLRGDITRILSKHAALAPYTGAAQWRADISNGILIVKYPVPGVTEPILPQFR